MTTPTPSRAAMIEVADYLDALEQKSGLMARIALRAVSKMLRQRAPQGGGDQGCPSCAQVINLKPGQTADIVADDVTRHLVWRAGRRDI